MLGSTAEANEVGSQMLGIYSHFEGTVMSQNIETRLYQASFRCGRQ